MKLKIKNIHILSLSKRYPFKSNPCNIYIPQHLKLNLKKKSRKISYHEVIVTYTHVSICRTPIKLTVSIQNKNKKKLILQKYK